MIKLKEKKLNNPYFSGIRSNIIYTIVNDKVMFVVLEQVCDQNEFIGKMIVLNKKHIQS